MKNSIKITDAKIIITLFTLAFSTFIALAVLNPVKPEPKSKNFVGIDATGVKHGAGEKSTIKYH